MAQLNELKRMQQLAGLITESQLNENNFFGFSYKNKNKDVDTKKLMAMDEKEAFQIARKWMEKNNLDPNEIQSMKQLDQYEIEKYDEITESQLGEETLNEVGMNMPWITKEPESWGGKPDKESKWFVHGDLETAKSKEETPAEFIAFEDNRPEYKSVFVGTNMPAENSKNSNFNKGKTTIAAKVDDNGIPTGLYWILGMDTSTSESLIKKIKDWSPLNNYIKDQLAKKSTTATPTSESTDIEKSVNEALRKFRKQK